MTAADVESYLAALDEPRRAALERLRAMILIVVPEAEQRMSYGMPAFTRHGKVFAGIAAFTHHVSYLPHSGSVLATLGDELAPYGHTKSSLHLPIDAAPPEQLIRRLVEVRLQELGQ